MKTFLLLTTCICLLGIDAFSQPVCGSNIIHDRQMRTNEAYKRAIEKSDERILDIIQTQEKLRVEGSSSAMAPPLYTIPVVVHIIHTGGAVGSTYNPTDAQITNTINYLNSVYNGTYPGTELGAGDIEIQFALATTGPDCNPTNGIHRMNGSAIPGYLANGVNASNTTGAKDSLIVDAAGWDSSHYYNIYVVHKIDGADGTSGQFIAGFAYFPYGPIDGTIMLATQMAPGRKTLPHEIGHALSLYHPFQGSTHNAQCPLNANCNTQGDRVCDTDPISYNATMAGVVNFNCRTGTNTCNGAPYNSYTESNIMNYLNEALCGNLFSPGQKARMLAAMNFPVRATLAVSQAFTPSLPQLSSFTAINNTVCTSVTGSPGDEGDYSGVVNLTLNNHRFYSEGGFFDGGYVDRTGSCLNLVVMQANTAYTPTLSVLGANREQLRGWIDYNNDGVFDNVTEQIFHVTDIAVGTYPSVTPPAFTIPAGALTGTVLRMRIISNVSGVAYGAQYTIADACYDPDYGQAEDFPIVISAAALPVKYEYFKGAMFPAFARLTWKTSYENNAATFEIERSYDGNNFEKIGQVAATNSSTGSLYSYDDRTFNGTTMHYRLRQVDKDGHAERSAIVTLQAEEITNSSIAILPNPVHDQCDIVINSPVRSTALIQLVDAAGKTVFTQQAGVFRRSVISVTAGVQKLPPGIYIARVTLDGKVTTKKLVKK